MKGFAILDTDATINLIGAGKLHVLKELFDAVYLTTQVREELSRSRSLQVREFARNPQEWIEQRDPWELDPKADALSRDETDRPIDPGEVEAFSLAKELTKDGKAFVSVISNDKEFLEFCNSQPGPQRTFVADYWSVVLQAVDRGLIDLNAERGELERHCQPGRSKDRDRINELGVPDNTIPRDRKGYTRGQTVDMMQNFFNERDQQQHANEKAQQHGDSKDSDKAQEQEETPDKDQEQEI